MPENSNANENIPECELSHNEIQEYCRRLEALEKEYKGLEAVATKMIGESLRGLIGPVFDSMLESKEKTLRFLRDMDPNRRRAAIEVGLHHWGLRTIIAEECEKLALTDSDIVVRQTAITTLGWCYSRKRDPKIGHLLATIVRDEKQPSQIRMTAHNSLVCLNGDLDNHVRNTFFVPFPENINWEIVQEYLDGWKS